MKLSIRVNDVLQDLDGFHRLAVETIGSRRFLVGIRNSGRRIALFAFRDDTPDFVERNVIEAMSTISKTLDRGRRVCVLSYELVCVEDDADAQRVLDDHNRQLESEREAIERTHSVNDQPTGNRNDV